LEQTIKEAVGTTFIAQRGANTPFLVLNFFDAGAHGPHCVKHDARALIWIDPSQLYCFLLAFAKAAFSGSARGVLSRVRAYCKPGNANPQQGNLRLTRIICLASAA
jgi:hypothetical protein